MDKRVNKIATMANIASYDDKATRDYIDGTPHIKHDSLRNFYSRLIVEVYDNASQYQNPPRILDLGAGEGSATLPFLELGAEVTAVDISESQLQALRQKCSSFANHLEVRCEDINEVIKNKKEKYDIIVVNSLLHHIPDYPGFIRETLPKLNPQGYFFSFQDPLRYDSVGKSTLLLTKAAYFFWRVFKGDLLGGVRRKIRRSRGVFLEDSSHDNTEYHVIRNGVDQDAIRRLFEEEGFECRIITYFSTQSRLFQPIGATLGMKNCFGFIATKANKLD